MIIIDATVLKHTHNTLLKAAQIIQVSTLKCSLVLKGVIVGECINRKYLHIYIYIYI